MRTTTFLAASLAAVITSVQAAEYRQFVRSFTEPTVTNWALPAGKVMSFPYALWDTRLEFEADVPGIRFPVDLYAHSVLVGPANIRVTGRNHASWDAPIEAVIVMRLDDAVPTVPAPVKPKLEWSPDLVTWTNAPAYVPGTDAGFWRVVLVPATP